MHSCCAPQFWSCPSHGLTSCPSLEQICKYAHRNTHTHGTSSTLALSNMGHCPPKAWPSSNVQNTAQEFGECTTPFCHFCIGQRPIFAPPPSPWPPGAVANDPHKGLSAQELRCNLHPQPRPSPRTRPPLCCQDSWKIAESSRFRLRSSYIIFKVL